MPPTLRNPTTKGAHDVASPSEFPQSLINDSDETAHMVRTYMPPDSVTAFQREFAEAIAGGDPAALEHLLIQWRRAAERFLNWSRG